MKLSEIRWDGPDRDGDTRSQRLRLKGTHREFLAWVWRDGAHKLIETGNREDMDYEDLDKLELAALLVDFEELPRAPE